MAAPPSPWLAGLLICLAAATSCRCGETTSGPAQASEDELVAAMADALCKTTMARDMGPLVKREESEAGSDELIGAWRRLFFQHEATLKPFGRGKHLDKDDAAHVRMAEATRAAVWKRCPSHVASHFGQNETQDLAVLFSYATGPAGPPP